MKLRRNCFMAVLLCAASSHAIADDAGSAAAKPDQQQVAAHVQALLEQCPADTRLSPEQESTKPIYVTKWGDTGPKILLIHGGEQAVNTIGGGPANFAKQKVLGQQGWQVSLPDRPGFGKSPSRGRDDQLADVRWIAQMLRSSGGSNLWGHSFGGAEALLAAGAAPGSVQSLVLIEPDLWPLAEAFPASEVPGPVQQFRDGRTEAILSSKDPAAYAEHFLSSFQPRQDGMKVWFTRTALKLAPGLSKKVGCGALQAQEADGAQFLQAVQIVRNAGIPVLIVTGGWDPSRDALGEWVAKLIGGQHVIVPSPDHIIMQENPTGLDRVAVRFMQEADRRQSAH